LTFCEHFSASLHMAGSLFLGGERGERRGKLTLAVLRGSDLKAMDLNGKSDPYVEVSVRTGAKIGGKKTDIISTPVIKKTLNPTWTKGNSITRHAVADTKYDVVKFKVWDKDTLSSDDLMGTGELKLGDVPCGELTETVVTLNTKGRLHISILVEDPNGAERQAKEAREKAAKADMDQMIEDRHNRAADRADFLAAMKPAGTSSEASNGAPSSAEAAATTDSSASSSTRPLVGGTVTLDGPSSSGRSGVSASDVGHVRSYEEERQREQQLGAVEAVLDGLSS
jgi:hypothetical protein